MKYCTPQPTGAKDKKGRTLWACPDCPRTFRGERIAPTQCLADPDKSTPVDYSGATFRALPCAHRLEVVASIACPTCDGRGKQVAVAMCKKHRLCTAAPQAFAQLIEGVMPTACATCVDRQVTTEEPRP